MNTKTTRRSQKQLLKRKPAEVAGDGHLPEKPVFLPPEVSAEEINEAIRVLNATPIVNPPARRLIPEDAPASAEHIFDDDIVAPDVVPIIGPSASAIARGLRGQEDI